eukprot:170623_1
MNRPTIKANRHKQTSKKHAIQRLVSFDDDAHEANTIQTTSYVPTIFASGAVGSQSVDISQKALIPSAIRRARSHTHQPIFYGEGCKEHEATDESDDERGNVLYYPSGAISTNVNKPMIHTRRRAKTHNNVIQKRYDYDSIWSVQIDAIPSDCVLIETVMNKPCVPVKRKQKTHNIDLNDLSK